MNENSGSNSSETLDAGIRARIDEIAGQTTELAIFQAKLETQELAPSLSGQVARLGRLIRELHSTVMHLPLSVPICEALVARIGEERYFIRMDVIAEVVRPGISNLVFENEKELLRFRGASIPILRLVEWLGRVSVNPLDGVGAALVVSRPDGARLALFVDDVLETQRILIRPLSRDLRELPGLAGGAVLSDGTVAVVLDVPQITEVAA